MGKEKINQGACTWETPVLTLLHYNHLVLVKCTFANRGIESLSFLRKTNLGWLTIKLYSYYKVMSDPSDRPDLESGPQEGSQSTFIESDYNDRI